MASGGVAGGAGGGIGQAAQDLLKEMNKGQQAPGQEGQGPKGASFQQSMGQAQQTQAPQAAGATSATAMTHQVAAAQQASNVLLQAQVRRAQGLTEVGQTKKTTETRMVKMLDGLIQGQDKMGEIMNMAMSGRQFSPPELLVMQASMFRFTQELELAGKVIEKATSGVKQTLNTQV